MAAGADTVQLSERAESRFASAFIVSRGYDLAFFLLPPVLALVLGACVAQSRAANEAFFWQNQHFTPSGIALGVFIHAHLFLVVFRSHLNRTVFETHPYRFTVVPALVFVGMLLSPWIAVTCSVLATFWDVYHSGAQTFGFGRIYDAKIGNDPQQGRHLDFALNQLLYAGPILAGATMMAHIEDFDEYEEVGAVFFTSIPPLMATHQRWFTFSILGLGLAFIGVYVWHHARLMRAGRRVSMQKVFLFASTGVVSIFTWGFNTWGEAFLIMNVFHALQYFGIVWAMEGKNLRRSFRLEQVPGGKAMTWLIFVSVALAYGLCVEAFATSDTPVFWSLTIVMSLMHFWYDGFIWSVRKKSV